MTRTNISQRRIANGIPNSTPVIHLNGAGLRLITPLVNRGIFQDKHIRTKAVVQVSYLSRTPNKSTADKSRAQNYTHDAKIRQKNTLLHPSSLNTGAFCKRKTMPRP